MQDLDLNKIGLSELSRSELVNVDGGSVATALATTSTTTPADSSSASSGSVHLVGGNGG